MRQQDRPIGLFDSGVGGLSILLELRKVLPSESFVYLADQKHLPYGEKKAAEIRLLASQAVRILLEHQVKLVVVACNTASVYALDYLRRQFEGIQFVGVVPVVKMLAELTLKKRVAVLTTPATARSSYLNRLIERFASGVKVFVVPLPGVERLVEAGKLDDERLISVLTTKLKPLIGEDIDCLGLGCTHYHFLKGTIGGIVGKQIQIVDPGKAVAARVKHLLAESNLATSSSGPEFEFLTTGRAISFGKTIERLMALKVRALEVG